VPDESGEHADLGLEILHCEDNIQNFELQLLAGGLDLERDVSLRSGRRVSDALRMARVHARLLDADAALEMIVHERASICAIGEVGLPWYGARATDANVDAQAKMRLAQFARIATELDLALILHAPHRRAFEALEIIRAAKVRRAVFHWHKADEQTTRAIIDAGYFISLTPEVAYRQRDQELARMLPANRMLVETDGPWPYGGQFAGRLTEPAFIKETVAAIAHLRCTTIDEIANSTTANARALFGISG